MMHDRGLPPAGCNQFIQESFRTLQFAREYLGVRVQAECNPIQPVRRHAVPASSRLAVDDSLEGFEVFVVSRNLFLIQSEAQLSSVRERQGAKWRMFHTLRQGGDPGYARGNGVNGTITA